MAKISFEDAILETLPFADELVMWCKKHPEFYKALKVIYSWRFLHLGAIVTSYSPYYPEDEIIGIFAYDYRLKNPKFKQDFIVNKNKLYKEFVLYTRNPEGSSKWVKDIGDFYKTYGRGGHYADTHHLSLEELPSEIQGRGRRVIEIADKMKHSFMVKPTREQSERIYNEARKIKSKNSSWVIKKKLT